MSDDHVFKVPAVKRKRPNLYCNETLDGIDDVWERSTVPSPYTSTGTDTKGQVVPESRLQSIGHGSNDISMSGHFYAKSKFDRQDFCPSSSTFPFGLVNELTSTMGMVTPDPLVSMMHKSMDGVDSSSSQIIYDSQYGNHSASSLHQMVPECYNSDDDSSMSPDILILRDESMANADSCSESSGSDVDWDSLTPPAPRSPGDHTVPDMYDLETITPPSDFLMSSYDYLASIQRSQLPRAHINQTSVSVVPTNTMQNSPSLHNSSRSSLTDHMVPDFYN